MSAALIAGGMAASALGSYMGNKAAAEASAEAAAQAYALRQQALSELSSMKPIELQALGYSPEEIQYLQGAAPLTYQQVADVNPDTINVDPATRAAQMSALNDLISRSEEGLSAQDRYNFMKNRRDVETAARGEEQAIVENLRQRGMSGTGVEAALRMMSSQNASDRLAEQQAAEAAANAQMRMAATQAQGTLAGSIRGQDIDVSKSNADILNQFAWNNSERARQIANMNTDLQNQYTQSELAERRRVSGANTSTRNEAQLLNKQQDISNDLTKQQSIRDKQMAMAGALTGGIPDIYAAGAANAANARGMWDTLGSLGMTGAQMYLSSQGNNTNTTKPATTTAMNTQPSYYYGNSGYGSALA